MITYSNGWHQYIKTVVADDKASGEVNYNTVGGTGPEHWTSLGKNSDGSYETTLWTGATISFDEDIMHVQYGGNSLDAEKISQEKYQEHRTDANGQ